MEKSMALLDSFRLYLSLSQRIKEYSLKGDLQQLEDLLDEREACQEEISLALGVEDPLLQEDTFQELLQILYTAKDINDEARNLLVKRKGDLLEGFWTLKKGQQVASSYSHRLENLQGASFFDKRS